MHTIHQSFIRGDIHHVEMAERDELGRQVGGFVVVDLPVSPALRAAIDADYAAAIAAQDEFHHPLAFKESQSRDTAENARRSSEALAALGIRHVVVVTHAWHMPRAMRHFRQAFGPQVDVIAAPMGPFSSSDDGRLLRWLPSAEGMRNCWRGLREWLGLLLT